MQALGGWLGLGLGLDMPSRNGPPNSSPRLTGTKRKGRRDEGEKEDTHSSPSSSSGTIKQPVKRLMANLSLGDTDDIRTESYTSHPLKSTSPHSPETLQDMVRYIKLNPHSDNTHEGGEGDINHHADEKRWHIIASEWIKQNINWNTDYYFEVFDPLNVDHYSAMLAFIAKVRHVYYSSLVYDPCVFVFMACKAIDPPLSDFPTSSTADKVFEIASVLTVRILKPLSLANLDYQWEIIEEYATKNEYRDGFSAVENKTFNEKGDNYDQFMRKVDLTRGGKNLAYIVASKTDETKYTGTGLSQGLRFIAFLFLDQYKDSLNIDGIVSWCVSNISAYILAHKFAFRTVTKFKYPGGGDKNNEGDVERLQSEIYNNRPFIIRSLYQELLQAKSEYMKYDDDLRNLDIRKEEEEISEGKYLRRREKLSSKRTKVSSRVEKWRTVIQKYYYAYMNDQFTNIPTKYEEIFEGIMSNNNNNNDDDDVISGFSVEEWYRLYKSWMEHNPLATDPHFHSPVTLKRSSILESLYWRTFACHTIYGHEWNTFVPINDTKFQERLTIYAHECTSGVNTNFKFIKGVSKVQSENIRSWSPSTQQKGFYLTTSKLKPIPNYRLLLGEKVGKLVLQNTLPKLAYKMRVYDPNNENQRQAMLRYFHTPDSNLVEGGIPTREFMLDEFDSECLIALVVYTNHNRDGMDFSGNKGFGNPYENDLQAFENGLSNREIVGLLVLRIVEPFNSYVDESGVIRILHDTLFRPITTSKNLDEQNDVYYGGKYDPKNVNPELWNQHQPKNVIFISHISAKSTPTSSYSYPEFLPRLLFLFSLKFIINNYALLNCAAIFTNASILNAYDAQGLVALSEGDYVDDEDYVRSVIEEIFIEAGCPKNIFVLNLEWWWDDNERLSRYSIFQENGLVYRLDGHLGEDWNWFLSFFPKPKTTRRKHRHLAWSTMIPLTYDETSENRKSKGEFYIDGMRTMFNKLNHNFLNLEGVKVSYYDTKDVEAPDIVLPSSNNSSNNNNNNNNNNSKKAKKSSAEDNLPAKSHFRSYH